MSFVTSLSKLYFLVNVLFVYHPTNSKHDFVGSFGSYAVSPSSTVWALTLEPPFVLNVTLYVSLHEPSSTHLAYKVISFVTSLSKLYFLVNVLLEYHPTNS